MSSIQIKNLTFCYPGSYDPVFNDVSFTIDTDWKLGLIGRNGRGKTTLLKLICGNFLPADYSGKILANIACDYFPYEIADKEADALSALRPHCGDIETWRLVKELKLLDCGEEILFRPFSTLSYGEQAKLMLAALFSAEGERRFLLIDEPTNHLDAAAREAVAEYLNRKKGFILVSHDRNTLDRCVDHILSINPNGIDIEKGNFSSWYVNKTRQDEYEAAENEKLTGIAKRLGDAVKRTGEWSDKLEATKYGTRNSGLRPDKGYIGHKSAKMMQRAKAIEKRRTDALEETEKLLRNVEKAPPIKLVCADYRAERIATLDKVDICYGGKTVCKYIGFEIIRGDRIALLGKNGSGKSSLIKLILGEKIPHIGLVKIGSGLEISYVPQCAEALVGSLKDYAVKMSVEESLLKSLLKKLDFSALQFEKDMSDFSSGQKKKVLLAASLAKRANLYIWDEPLNFIDIFSRIQLEKLIMEFCPTMLFVEHDKAFVQAVSTKTVELG